MNLSEIAPRLQTIVHPKRKSDSLRPETLQAAPSSHPRTAAISTNDPPRPDFIPASRDSVFIDSRHRRVPQQRHAAALRALHHSLMQNLPAYSEAVLVRKTSAHRRTIILKLNSVKRASVRLAQFNSKLIERRQRIRQEPFSAGFGNWGFRAVRNDHSKTLLACCNRGGKPGWTSTDNKHIRLTPHASPVAAKLAFLHRSEGLATYGFQWNPAARAASSRSN